MTEATLVTYIKGLETQLAVLKAQVKRLSAPTPPQSFADLCGILAGNVSSSEEEIEAVKYRFDLLRQAPHDC
jgi:hypothetical protein